MLCKHFLRMNVSFATPANRMDFGLPQMFALGTVCDHGPLGCALTIFDSFRYASAANSHGYRAQESRGTRSKITTPSSESPEVPRLGPFT
jgi:hypothetical protein